MNGVLVSLVLLTLALTPMCLGHAETAAYIVPYAKMTPQVAAPTCTLSPTTAYATNSTAGNCSGLVNATSCKGLVCAAGYTGTANVTCSTQGANFILSGCRVSNCTLRLSTNYTTNSTAGNCSGLLNATQCKGIVCAPEYTGTPIVACNLNGSSFTLSGCSAIIPTCSLATWPPAYVANPSTGNCTGSVSAAACQAGIVCAAGFSGIPVVSCNKTGANFSLSGCYANNCSLPALVSKYTIGAGCSGNLTATNCTGLSCTPVIAYGTPTMTCPVNGGSFNVTGCHTVKCSLPAEHEGYTYADSNCSGNVSVAGCLGVTCAYGYLGDVSVSCPANGGHFILDGCEQIDGDIIWVTTSTENSEWNVNDTYPYVMSPSDVILFLWNGTHDVELVHTDETDNCELDTVTIANENTTACPSIPEFEHCFFWVPPSPESPIPADYSEMYFLKSGLSSDCADGMYLSVTVTELCELPAHLPEGYVNNGDCVGRTSVPLCTTGLTCSPPYYGIPAVSCNSSGEFELSGCTYIEPVCGNLLHEFGEGCDDGNSIEDDGCSSTCHTYSHATQPELCNCSAPFVVDYSQPLFRRPPPPSPTVTTMIDPDTNTLVVDITYPFSNGGVFITGADDMMFPDGDAIPDDLPPYSVYDPIQGGVSPFTPRGDDRICTNTNPYTIAGDIWNQKIGPNCSFSLKLVLDPLGDISNPTHRWANGTTSPLFTRTLVIEPDYLPYVKVTGMIHTCFVQAVQAPKSVSDRYSSSCGRADITVHIDLVLDVSSSATTIQAWADITVDPLGYLVVDITLDDGAENTHYLLDRATEPSIINSSLDFTVSFIDPVSITGSSIRLISTDTATQYDFKTTIGCAVGNVQYPDEAPQDITLKIRGSTTAPALVSGTTFTLNPKVYASPTGSVSDVISSPQAFGTGDWMIVGIPLPMSLQAQTYSVDLTPESTRDTISLLTDMHITAPEDVHFKLLTPAELTILSTAIGFKFVPANLVDYGVITLNIRVTPQLNGAARKRSFRAQSAKRLPDGTYIYSFSVTVARDGTVVATKVEQDATQGGPFPWMLVAAPAAGILAVLFVALAVKKMTQGNTYTLVLNQREDMALKADIL